MTTDASRTDSIQIPQTVKDALSTLPSDSTTSAGTSNNQTTDSEPGSPSHHTNNFILHPESNASTTTNLSTQAQTGSAAPSDASSSSHPSPRSSESPDSTDDYETAKIPNPPQINLAPRTHPLAGGSASHHGVLLCENEQADMDVERAKGTLSPGYDTSRELHNADAAVSVDSRSDPGRKTKKGAILSHLRGEAKVISGHLKRDPEKVEEGKRMKGKNGYVSD